MNFFAATEIGRAVDQIALFATAITVFFSVLVAGLIVYFGWKYRAGSPADRSGRLDSSWTIEILNFSVITALGLILFFLGARLFYREIAAPRDALELHVIGKQWMWTFQYPDGPRQIGHILVPRGRPVRVLLASDDVIHSFFIPAFRIKQDAVPGRYTSLWFEASELGTFDVLCSEYCGISHSGMRAVIEVVTPEAFAAYFAREKAVPLSNAGAVLYRSKGCAGCHEDGRIAPSLAGFYGHPVHLQDGRTVMADENYVRVSLFEPGRDIVAGFAPLMPTYRGQLSEEEVAALVDYLRDRASPGRFAGKGKYAR